MRKLFLMVVMALVPSVSAEAQDGMQKFGDLYTMEERDPMTDVRSMVVIATATDAAQNRGKRPAVMWSCSASNWSQGPMPVLMLDGYMGGSDGHVRVQYRFDNRPAEAPQSWALFSGNRSAMHLDHWKDLHQGALSANRMVLTVTDLMDGEVRTSIIPLGGLRALLGRMTC